MRWNQTSLVRVTCRAPLGITRYSLNVVQLKTLSQMRNHATRSKAINYNQPKDIKGQTQTKLARGLVPCLKGGCNQCLDPHTKTRTSHNIELVEPDSLHPI